MRAKDLFEVSLIDKYPNLFNSIKKYHDKWVHFSHINKLGINPRIGHGDPPGIYFYPCDFFLDNGHTEDQYATSFKYYYICDIDLNSNGVNLKTLTETQALRIAEQNNWKDELSQPLLYNDYNHIKRLTGKSNYKIGEIFYYTAKYLNDHKSKSFLSLFKGIDYIYDPGLEIIEPLEPEQIIVLNPSIITKIDFGINKNISFNIRMDILKKLQSEYNNSNIKIKNDVIILEIPIQEHFIIVSITRELDIRSEHDSKSAMLRITNTYNDTKIIKPLGYKTTEEEYNTTRNILLKYVNQLSFEIIDMNK